MYGKRALFAAVVVLATSQAATWTAINRGLTLRGNYGIIAVIPDPKNPDTVYALTNHIALFKSIDAAATWHALPGVTGVNALAIDPVNSSTLYAAMAQGIAKSLDGGETWTVTYTGLAGYRTNVDWIVIDPLYPSTVYAIDFLNPGSGIPLLKTIDAGATWTVVYRFPEAAVPGRLTIDPLSSSTLYVAVVSDGSILKSADGGQTWAQFKPGLNVPASYGVNTMPIAVDPSDSATLYAGSFAAFSMPASGNRPGAGTISKTSDAGENWEIIRNGIPANAYVQRLQIDPVNHSMLYAGYVFGNGAGVLKSVDAGETWTTSYTLSGGNLGNLDLGMAMDVLYAAWMDLSGGGVLRSGDAGVTWNASNTGLEYFDVGVLALDPAHPGALYAGGTSGLFKRTAGSPWTNLNLPQIAANFEFPAENALVRSLAVDFTNPDVLYVVTSRLSGCAYTDNVLFKTNDGGVTWIGTGPPDSGCLFGWFTSVPTPVLAMDPNSPETLYLSEGESEDGGYALLKTADGGAAWKSIWDYAGGLQSGVNALVIDQRNSSTLYAGIGESASGSPWDSGPPPAIGFFTGSGGSTAWTNLGITNAPVGALAADPADSNTLYAATQSINTQPVGFRGIFKTTDAGATWSPVNNGLDGLAATGAVVTSMAVDPFHRATIYAATSGGGIYRTQDGGATWAPFNKGLSSFDIRVVVADSGGIFAATAAGIFMLQNPGSRGQ